MNPFFWLIVLILTFLIWIELRKWFIQIGEEILQLFEDIKNTLKNNKE